MDVWSFCHLLLPSIRLLPMCGPAFSLCYYVSSACLSFTKLLAVAYTQHMLLTYLPTYLGSDQISSMCKVFRTVVMEGTNFLGVIDICLR